MIVGVARLGLRLEFSHSLKEKRNALRRIKDRTKATHDVRLSEVGDQGAWQSAALGFAVVGIDKDHVQGRVDKVIRFVEDMGMGEVVGDDREVLYFGDAAYE